MNELSEKISKISDALSSPDLLPADIKKIQKQLREISENLKIHAAEDWNDDFDCVPEGRPFAVKTIMTFRWLPYKNPPKKAELSDGKPGRWQWYDNSGFWKNQQERPLGAWRTYDL